MERVEALRKEKTEYKSIGALADAAGVPRDLFTNLKKGRQKTVRLELAERIAKKLGTSVDYLYGLTDNPGRKKSRIDPELAQLTDEIAVLSPARREDLAVIVEMLQQIELLEVKWHESFMRLVDRFLTPSESLAFATALEFTLAGNDTAAAELIESILVKRDAQQSID
ncbi:MAG: helix-turn-helix domain-containing protein [Solirubrobacterales bacterium]